MDSDGRVRGKGRGVGGYLGVLKKTMGVLKKTGTRSFSFVRPAPPGPIVPNCTAPAVPGCCTRAPKRLRKRIHQEVPVPDAHDADVRVLDLTAHVDVVVGWNHFAHEQKALDLGDGRGDPLHGVLIIQVRDRVFQAHADLQNRSVQGSGAADHGPRQAVVKEVGHFGLRFFLVLFFFTLEVKVVKKKKNSSVV
jgi:hypothetical protein